MNRVVEEKGEARVKSAVEERMCMVASRMKCGPSSSSGASGSDGSSEGSFGDERCGAGKVIGKFDRSFPRAG